MAEDAGEARVRDSSDVELPELPGSKRVSFAAGPEEPCRRSTSSLGGEFLTSSAGGVSEVQQMPYASVVVACTCQCVYAVHVDMQCACVSVSMQCTCTCSE